MLERVQRVIAIRMVKGFNTMFFDAACVIANLIPIGLKVNQASYLYKISRGLLNISETDATIDRPMPFAQWIHPADVITIKEQQPKLNTAYQIFTEGSKRASNVGCALVFYYNGTEILQEKYKLHENCSNNQANNLR